MGQSIPICVKKLLPYQRPSEKFVSTNGKYMATEELIAILLSTGYKGAFSLVLAKDVIDYLPDGVYGLNHVNVQELQKLKGIGKDKAITLCTAIELGRRLGELRVKHNYEDFSNPDAVAEYVMERMRHESKEVVCVALLNAKNKLIAIETISTCGLTASLAEQRVVFRKAIKHNVADFILIHNHLSGDSQPSAKDIRIPKIFYDAGDVMGIPLLDHIVIEDGTFFSLYRMKII